MGITEFIQTYFINPLTVNPDGPYNIYNTITYGILLAVAVYYLYGFLNNMKMEFDGRFFIATIPFIALAAVLRVLRDGNILESVWLVSPLIYVSVFIMTVIPLVGSFLVERKNPRLKYHVVTFTLGVGLVFVFGSLLSVVNVLGAAKIFGLGLAASGFIFLGSTLLKSEFFSKINLGILYAAMFDAASTYIGVAQYGYFEKHVLPNLLFEIFGPWAMFPLKLSVLGAILYILDKYEDDKNFNNFIKFAILVLTLAPAFRNTLRLLVGV
nr:DUF63 family protein [Candidatus Undinarchaeales archaeon ERR594346 U_76725]